jgi:hypothetical protein
MMGPSEEPWFRCRIFLPQGPDTRGGPAGAPRHRAVLAPTLLVGVKDTAGVPLVLKHTDRVEVDSPFQGRAVWQVQAEPEPLRKRRRVIGYQVAVQRLEDAEFDPVPQVPRAPVGASLSVGYEVEG